MRRVAGLLSLWLAAASVAAQEAGSEEQELGQAGSLWNLGELVAGKTYPTTLSAHNLSCRGRRTFEIRIEDAPWLVVTGPEQLVVRRGESAVTDAVVDLRRVAPGSYSGRVKIECLDCPPSCRQDYRALEVRMEVVAATGAAPGSGSAVVWEDIDLTRKAG